MHKNTEFLKLHASKLGKYSRSVKIIFVVIKEQDIISISSCHMKPCNSTQTTFVLEMPNDPKCGLAGQQAPELWSLHLAETAETSDFSHFLSPFAGLSLSLDGGQISQETTIEQPSGEGASPRKVEKERERNKRIHLMSECIER